MREHHLILKIALVPHIVAEEGFFYRKHSISKDRRHNSVVFACSRFDSRARKCNKPYSFSQAGNDASTSQ